MLGRRAQREEKKIRENNGGTLSKHARFIHKIAKNIKKQRFQAINDKGEGIVLC